MVNFFRSSALNTRLLRLLCQEFDDKQNTLLFHTEVRWLSRGNMSRVHSLRKEISCSFMRNADLRVALSKTEPRIDELVKAKQAQPSH